MNLVFPAGSNSDSPPMCVDISIIDDASTVEPDETFTVTLSTSSSVVSLGNNMTIITITNTVESITEDITNATVADFNTAAVIGGAIAVFVVLVIFILIIVAIVCVKYRRSRMQKKGKCMRS